MGGLAFLGLMVVAAAPVRAEEVRPALNAPLILNLLALPVEKPDAAFRESLRAAPVPRATGGWEQLDDGTYRYGDARLTVTVKNPCPEGKRHVPLALPGRNR